MLLHPAHGEPVLMVVANLFGIQSANGSQLYCFASGYRFETGDPSVEANNPWPIMAS
jgi:hypothetical protein